MKRYVYILLVIALFLIMLDSCDLVPVSIDERIDMFIGELNSTDRSETYKNFHPDTTDYDAMKDPDFFESGTLAIANISFSFTASSSAYDIGGGQQQVDGTFYYDSGNLSSSCYFIMQQDGQDWFIREFYIDTLIINKK